MSDMMETTPAQEAWIKASRTIGNENMLGIGGWVKAYVDERLAADAKQPQPAEPRAEGDVPEWFHYEWFTSDDAVIKAKAAIDATITRRVAEATAERDRRIAELEGHLRHEVKQRDHYMHEATVAYEQRNSANKQLAAAQAEVERLKAERDSMQSQCQTILNSLEWNGDGYAWNPTDGDYRETPMYAMRRGADAVDKRLAKLTAELAAANARAAKAAAAIVAWLRKQSSNHAAERDGSHTIEYAADCDIRAEVVSEAADAIERGEAKGGGDGCVHEWKDVDSDIGGNRTDVRCVRCGMCGERDDSSGEVFYPAT